MTAPSTLDAVAKILADARTTATAMASSFPTTPIAIETPLTRRWAQADARREAVKRMSLAGQPVASIAAALGISAGYVVRLRSRLGVGRMR